jgi:hypothetical protein
MEVTGPHFIVVTIGEAFAFNQSLCNVVRRDLTLHHPDAGVT